MEGFPVNPVGKNKCERGDEAGRPLVFSEQGSGGHGGDR